MSRTGSRDIGDDAERNSDLPIGLHASGAVVAGWGEALADRTDYCAPVSLR